ncbi:hypothetical protein KSP40_PGU009101 [Platanthera guangdongensis]|uniref:Uncharacterized protein n=1 Tax=Platanthera guangdongensis TaxID=2320717 RepID=A0ABR2MD32_9ASPA
MAAVAGGPAVYVGCFIPYCGRMPCAEKGSLVQIPLGITASVSDPARGFPAKAEGKQKEVVMRARIKILL